MNMILPTSRLLLVAFLIVGPESDYADGADPGKAKGLAARRFLENHPPMFSSAFELHFTDDKMRHHAEHLFSEQMEALHQASKCDDPSIIPTLVRFLDYTSDNSQFPYTDMNKRLMIYTGGPTGPDFKSLCDRRPALAAIIRIPDSSSALLNYTLNMHNGLNLRLAVFHILRYADMAKFRIAANTLNKELSNRGPVMKSFLDAIEDGTLIFDGIHPGEFPD